MEEKEYYKQHIYDEERVQDSTRFMNLQKIEIDFYKRQLLIDEFFSNESEFVKRKQCYNKLITLFNPKSSEDPKNILSSKIFEYLSNNKETLLSGTVPPSFPKFEKSVKKKTEKPAKREKTPEPRPHIITPAELEDIKNKELLIKAKALAAKLRAEKVNRAIDLSKLNIFAKFIK